MSRKEPIIKSLLDLDYYKLTMAQFAWKYYWYVPVQYAFKCRTPNVALADIIPQTDLQSEFNHVSELRYASDELSYLTKSAYIPEGRFHNNFVNFLRELKLPRVEAIRNGGSYKIEPAGLWKNAMLHETLDLSIVNELYYENLMAREGLKLADLEAEGRKRLARKIEIIKMYPDLRIIEFGTRRRFSHDWQGYVIETLAREVPAQLVGTSNVYFAKKFGLRPIGTFAHELDMVLSGAHHESDASIRGSHQKVMELWWEMFGEPLSIALTDTYGTDFFFRDMTADQARLWRGLRQDSGDPIVFGEKATAFYEKLGIDPKTKTIVFSDGLDIETIVTLYERFSARINVSFGWGTNLTNDLGLKALSLVIKAAMSCGYGTVKLSDNMAKAMGSKEDVERFMRIFGYTETLNQPCVY